MAATTSSSNSTSSASSSSSSTESDQGGHLPLSDLRRKLHRTAETRPNQDRFNPNEVMTIHAELSSDNDRVEAGPAPAKKAKPNDSLYSGKFWNDHNLIPRYKTRHTISKIMNEKNKKIALLEYNLA